MQMHRVLTIALISLCVAGGCASSKRIDKPFPVAPPLPEPYRSGNFTEFYPDASKRVHESGEVVLEFTVEPTARGDKLRATKLITVDEEKSAKFPRLIAAARQIAQSITFPLGDAYKRTLTASIVFEISPCGSVSHSEGVDYDLNLCIDPVVYSQVVIPEFVHWYEAYDSALSIEDRKRFRNQMNNYARSSDLLTLARLSPNELRVWVTHPGGGAISGIVVSNSLVKRCTLSADDLVVSSGSTKGPCTVRKRHGSRRYFAPLKELEPFDGHAYRCIPDVGPEPDAIIDIEWVDAGKRFAVRSNDPRVGYCIDKPSSLIAKVIANVGWQELP